MKPLSRHKNGQWYKKVGKKFYYFGTEYQEAVRRWLHDKDFIYAGVTPDAHGELTVGVLITKFLDSKDRMVKSGELTERTFQDYKRMCKEVADCFTKQRTVGTLRPEDFGLLRSQLSVGRGPASLKNSVNNVRVMFHFAYRADFIDKPVKFGDEFKPPSMKVRRAVRSVRLFTAEDIRRFLSKASTDLRAQILLGINCGFGQSDISTLTETVIDYETGFISHPRPKTGASRRCWLWPETIEALKLVKRPKPFSDDEKNLMFLTATGSRLVRTTKSMNPVDALGTKFRRLLNRCGFSTAGINFYTLRRTFRTVADEMKDASAAALIMGHTNAGDMGALYTQRISDERIKAIAEHVRAWLNLPRNKVVGG